MLLTGPSHFRLGLFIQLPPALDILWRARTQSWRTVEALTSSQPSKKAAEEFHITPERRNRIVVTKISEQD
jgi:hypothetical protein